MTNYANTHIASSTRPHMGMGQSLRAFFQNYARFNGRAGRSEFWWAQLGVFLISFLLAAAVSVAQPSHGDSSTLATILSAIYGIWGLLLIIPNLALEARRLHDTNRSGWFLLLHLIPVFGSIALLLMWCGQPKPEGARFDAETQPKLGS